MANLCVGSTIVRFEDSRLQIKDCRIQVYDMAGRLVEERNVELKDCKLKIEDCKIGKNLRAGIYFVKVKGYEPTKIIKLR